MSLGKTFMLALFVFLTGPLIVSSAIVGFTVNLIVVGFMIGYESVGNLLVYLDKDVDIKLCRKLDSHKKCGG